MRQRFPKARALLQTTEYALYYRIRDASYQGLTVDDMLASLSADDLLEEIAWLELKAEEAAKEREEAARRSHSRR
jgi:hypothetical protein